MGVKHRKDSIRLLRERPTLGGLQEQLAQADETAIALYEAQAAQEEVNAQQDEALLEIYEKLGG